MEEMDVKRDELFEQLQHGLVNGIINVTDMQEQMGEYMDRKIYLRMHKYRIWEGKDGKFYTYLPDEERGRVLKKKSSRKDIEELVIEFYKNHTTVNELFRQWNEYKLLTKSIQEQSYNRYETDFRRFIQSTDFGKMKVHDVTEDILEEFIIHTILDNKLTRKAYSQLRTILSGMFKFAKKKKYSKLSISNFFEDLELSRNMFERNQKHDEEEAFTDAEVRKITAYVKDNPSIWNLAVLFVFQTGLRVGELVVLKPEDIDWEQCVLSVNKTEIRVKDKETGVYTVAVSDQTKTECGERKVILPPAAIWTLEQICSINPRGSYLFENKKGKRIRGTTISKKICWICLELGIEQRSIHKARKTYISELFNAGVESSIIKAQSGHSDILTSLRYYYKDNHSLEERKAQIAKAVIAG